jgi:hypothetical protein
MNAVLLVEKDSTKRFAAGAREKETTKAQY